MGSAGGRPRAQHHLDRCVGRRSVFPGQELSWSCSVEGSRSEEISVSSDAPTVVKVTVGGNRKTCKAVAVAKGVTPKLSSVIGGPAEGATVAERTLEQHGAWLVRNTPPDAGDPVTREWIAEVSEAFTVLPEGFFVFVKQAPPADDLEPCSTVSRCFRCPRMEKARCSPAPTALW